MIDALKARGCKEILYKETEVTHTEHHNEV